MRRFFFQPEDCAGDIVSLSETESKHMKTVLRLQIGDCVELMDGSGSIYSAKILKLAKCVLVEILAVIEVVKEEATSLWVGQGMIKSKKMDLIVQKCTELGVQRFTPFISNRCQGRLDEAQQRKKQERWQRISEEACKQCTRPRPMEIVAPLQFHEVLVGDDAGIVEKKLLFWEQERTFSIGDLQPLTTCDRVRILLGPEGGITEEEIHLARDAGWQSVSLGSRILRAETATMASVSILQYLLGNM